MDREDSTHKRLRIGVNSPGPLFMKQQVSGLGFPQNVLLKNHTTFKIGGPAKLFFIAKTKEDLISALKTAKRLKLPFFILGGGSNLLISDKGYKGLVIKLQMSGIRVQDGKIYTQAGTELWGLIELSFKKGLTGLEWAAGIPGTIGGAIYGNAGAFGSFMADVIKNITVLDSKTLKIKNIPLKDCKFGNKDSILKHPEGVASRRPYGASKKNLIILSAILQLKKGNKKRVQEKIKEYLKYRTKTHPLNFPSAGCAFKNPALKIKNKKLLNKFPELQEFSKKGLIPTGYLIEKCGLKGKKIGRAEISEKHANFIINLGGARASDVLKLIKLTKKKVKNKFGINLEEEIQIIS